MNSIRIAPRADERNTPVLTTDNPIHMADGAEITIASLANGTTFGRATVAFAFVLPDGQEVLVETTLRLFLTAAMALAAAHSREARKIGFKTP